MAVSSEPTSDPLVYFDQLTATVEELGRSRWMLGQVLSLADDAPGLTNVQLRDRLTMLADWARMAPGPGPFSAAHAPAGRMLAKGLLSRIIPHRLGMWHAGG